MTHAWHALRDRLLGHRQLHPDPPTDQPDEEHDMPAKTTAAGAAERALARLRDQLDELDTEAENDPLDLAEDLAAWKSRDQLRRDRRVGIVSEIRRVERFGDLIDNDTAMNDVRGYLAATAEARAMLTKVQRTGALPSANGNTLQDGRGATHLKAWLGPLTTLSTRLSLIDPDAARVLIDEWDAWFAARRAWWSAYAAADGDNRRAPEPEVTGDLPAGLTYGIHLTNPASKDNR